MSSAFSLGIDETLGSAFYANEEARMAYPNIMPRLMT